MGEPLGVQNDYYINVKLLITPVFGSIAVTEFPTAQRYKMLSRKPIDLETIISPNNSSSRKMKTSKILKIAAISRSISSTRMLCFTDSSYKV